ncbi:MAG TPA: response regulator, partial [Limnochordales bacterium]
SGLCAMNRKIILLVEDDPDHELLTIRALRRHGMVADIVVARDGVAALEYLLGGDNGVPAASPLPNIILLDLKLPRLNGFEVLVRLRQHERTRFVPVVVLSSSDEASDIANCYRYGANSYIRKPVDSVKFTEVTRQLGQYWLELNEVSGPAGGC